MKEKKRDRSKQKRVVQVYEKPGVLRRELTAKAK